MVVKGMKQKIQFVLSKVNLAICLRVLFVSITLLKLFLPLLHKCPIQILVNYQKNIMKLEK
jgi:hypothetical protein